MIVFNLNYKNCKFKFEGWFDSSIDFEKQNKSNLITCPSCDSSLIKKSLMTPNLSKKSNSKKINSKRTYINKITNRKRENTTRFLNSNCLKAGYLILLTMRNARV